MPRTAGRRPSDLALCRIASGLTQAELAERAGLARETVSRIEGGHAPNLRTARALATALGWPVDTLFPQPDEAPQP